VKKDHILNCLDLIGHFQKRYHRGAEFLEKMAGVGKSEVLFTLLEGFWMDWFYYKRMVRLVDKKISLFSKFSEEEKKEITTQMLSSCRKSWNQKYPEWQISPLFMLDK